MNNLYERYERAIKSGVKLWKCEPARPGFKCPRSDDPDKNCAINLFIANDFAKLRPDIESGRQFESLPILIESAVIRMCEYDQTKLHNWEENTSIVEVSTQKMPKYVRIAS